MLLSNLEYLPGHRITRQVGLVYGTAIRNKAGKRDMRAHARNLVAGEVPGYTDIMSHGRNEAVERMIAQAEHAGANAVINIRLGTASIMNDIVEFTAYGTAVVVQPVASPEAEA